jgi:hypothetical protein
MRKIRAFWWNRGPGRGNFGDELGPAILRVLARAKVEWAPPKAADIVAVGSVLEPWFWPSGDASAWGGIVWGAGRMFGQAPFAVRAAGVALLRGPRTLERLDGLDGRAVPTGDPGLLADMFVTRPEKKYSLGLIPHWSQADHAIWNAVAAQDRRVKKIDPRSGYERVVNEIAQCDAVASASLHGLIAADGVGVPNVWARLRDKAALADADARFKFGDYRASLGLDDASPRDIDANTSPRSLLNAALAIGVKDVRRVKQRVLDSFPL